MRMFGGRGQPPVNVTSPSSLVVRNDQGDERMVRECRHA